MATVPEASTCIERSPFRLAKPFFLPSFQSVSQVGDTVLQEYSDCLVSLKYSLWKITIVSAGVEVKAQVGLTRRSSCAIFPIPLFLLAV